MAPLKLLVAGLVCFFGWNSAHAALVLLSANRSVSVSGIAGGIDGNQTYSYNQSSLGFGDFSESVSGSAEWNDTTIVIPGNTLPQTYRANSSASQNSTITTDAISAQASLRAISRVGLQGPYFNGTSSASTIFEVDFRIVEDTLALLSLSMGLSGHDLPWPQVTFSLTSANHGTILTDFDLHSIRLGNLSSLLLQPDDYRLVFNASATAVTDPFGDSKFFDMDWSLRIASIEEGQIVPDMGSTLTLLAAGLLFIGAACMRLEH